MNELANLTEAWAGRQLHFIAIGGAGMSGLALVASQLGAEVTGSDRADSSYLERLRHAGLEPKIGHDADAVPEGAEVVISSAIAEDNPELARARERGQRIIHRGELLAELCRLKRLIAVAGAHGKTTTAAIIAYALARGGADPAFLIGGELRGNGAADSNAAWGAGEWMVAEADESDGSFLELEPEIAVITNVELDHHSHWSSERALRDAFGQFAAGARGVVVGSGLGLADSAPRRLAFGIDLAGGHPDTAPGDERVGAQVQGPRRGGPVPDVAASQVRAGAVDSTFTARLPDGFELEVTLPLPGAHNILNALAALAALHLALDGDQEQLAALAATLDEFPGVARRLERKGSRSGATIVDDYAHHPTEVAAALASFADPPPRRLIAVFQPHLYSRTKALAGEFGKALAAADEIVVLDVYPAREEAVGPLAGVSGRQVAEAAADHSGGRPVWWLGDLDSAERALGPRLRDGDVLVTLGAGDVFELADRLVGQDEDDDLDQNPDEPRSPGRPRHRLTRGLRRLVGFPDNASSEPE